MENTVFDRRHLLAAFAATTGTTSPLLAQTKKSRQHYVFVYFRNREKVNKGASLAISDDGLNYRSINSGRAVIEPMVGESKLMRDPFIIRDPRNGQFHMLWTTSWAGVTIGHASSKNLIDWTSQQAIPVMQGFEGTQNCWAPEAIFDPASGRFIIFWASTIEGAFMETADPNGKASNHRIYMTSTRDFKAFSPTKLYFDPGFSVIDSTFVKFRGRLIMIFKDETENPPHKQLLWTEAKSPKGPFGKISMPFTPAWVEGPTAIVCKDKLIVFYDIYKENRFGALATDDLITWHDISSSVTLPKGLSHGTILDDVPATVFHKLERL